MFSMRHSVMPRLVMMVLLLALSPVFALMMIQRGGAEPLKDRGWPKGVLAFVNLPSRISWQHVMGNFGWDSFTLEYQGDTAAFNRALACFAKIRAPELKLTVMPGTRKNGDKKSLDWVFSPVNPRNFHSYQNNFRKPETPVPLPPPEIFVYLGGGRILWDKVVVPPSIKVTRTPDKTAAIPKDGDGRLSGSIYDMDTGKPVAGASVYIAAGRGQKETEAIPVLKTDDDGAFSITDLPKGSYQVNVEAEGYASYNAGRYHANGRNIGRKIVYLGKAVTVAGTVIDSDGLPARGVRLNLDSPIGFDGRPYPPPREWEPVVTDQEGRFEVTGLPEGRINITVDTDSGFYGRSQRQFPAPADDVRLMVSRTGTVKGMVVDSEGNPLGSDTRVLLIQRGDLLDRFIVGEAIGANGAFELSSIPAGEYLIGQNKGCLYDGTDPTAQVVFIKDGGTVTVRLQFPVDTRSGKKEKPPAKPVKLTGRKAPPLAMASWGDGKGTTLEALAGKVVVLVFWSSRDEDYDVLFDELKLWKDRGIRIVAIHQAGGELDMLSFLTQKLSMTVDMGMDSSSGENRPGMTFARYGVTQTPAIYIIDREGRVKYQDLPPAALPRALKKMLPPADGE